MNQINKETVVSVDNAIEAIENSLERYFDYAPLDPSLTTQTYYCQVCQILDSMVKKYKETCT
jgi:hypothetical protein